MTFYLLGVTSLLLLCTELAGAVCGNPPPVWRNDNITCPDRAVCADVFEMTRDWYNGTRCHERRVLNNCLCPNQRECPTDDPRYELFSSRSHKFYVCQPVCTTVPWCGNVEPRPPPRRPQDNRRDRDVRPNRVVAFTAEQSAPEFGNKTFYRVNCRCPRHHTPSSRRGRDRAVKAYRWRYHAREHRYSTLYVCDSSLAEEQMPDPCAPRRAVLPV